MTPNSSFGFALRSFVLRVATMAFMSVALIGCYSSQIKAQWTTNDNNINNTNTGNVGIGTPSRHKPLR